MPKYSLAVLDQATLGGSGATPFARFLGAFGLSQSKYLTMEAIAVQIAEIPLDRFGNVIRAACRNGNSILGNPTKIYNEQTTAFGAMLAQYYSREGDMPSSGAPNFEPQIMIPRRVFYMRGINYVFNDSSVASAVISAAFNTRMGTIAAPGAPKPAQTEPSVGNAKADDKSVAALVTSISALNKSIDALRSQLPAGDDAGFGFSGARATARGIEMVQYFDRPIAFGYDPLVWNLSYKTKIVNGKVEADKDAQDRYQWQRGFRDLCSDFNG
jgi:hypothetical protein